MIESSMAGFEASQKADGVLFCAAVREYDEPHSARSHQVLTKHGNENIPLVQRNGND